MKLRDNYLLLLLFVCFAIFFVNLDAIFVNIMEARNFTTAREMIHLDHWIFTTLNNEPRYEKPPLPTWLTAVSMLIFGTKNLIAARLPAAVMGSVVSIFLYKLAFRYSKNQKYAFLSGLIAATSFYILFSGRDGQWDIHTHAWMIMAIYCLFQIFQGTGKLWRNALFSGIFIGCSFLSKGPVSMYALLLPFLIAYGLTYRYKSLKVTWKPILLTVSVAFILGASWALYVFLFDTNAVSEITEKETGRWLDYNVRPFYYYWSFVIQSGIWTIPSFVALLYPYLKNRVFDKKAYLFTLIWTLCGVVLLSIIPEKKSRYLLPVMLPMALNTAFYIEYLFRRFDMLPRKETWIVFFNFGLIALIGLLFPLAGYLYFGEQIQNFLGWYIMISIILFSIGILIFWYLKTKKIKAVFYLTVWFIISIVFFGLPIASKIEENPAYQSISIVDMYREQLKLNVYEFRGFTPELIWEYGQPIDILYNGTGYEKPIESEFLLLATEEEKEELFKTFEGYSIEKIEEIDMNPVGNKHKERLYRDLYKIDKF
ncbi:ArnT family glycosyltransferase [Christiangramia portivictoriae]|uniref:ArnT family glycosyltransferase n=1 Tax=Christiangramia portivictoriae TaxID=326069 RepID=UPI0004284A7F|nr:glycosyltransferase family 39 protein [Christiangramia portivictoriae]